VRACAEALPFAHDTFDVAMGVLTVHHWADRERGLREMVRVAGRVAIMYFEPALYDRLWMYAYWPEVKHLQSESDPPGEAFFRAHLDVEQVVVVPVPADCSDHFGAAYWRQPEAYLDGDLVQGMSSFAQLDTTAFECGAARLRADLESGAWDERFGHLRGLEEYDLGYRIVTGFASVPK
jgi:SAM-dependent methyltransferase